MMMTSEETSIYVDLYYASNSSKKVTSKIYDYQYLPSKDVTSYTAISNIQLVPLMIHPERFSIEKQNRTNCFTCCNQSMDHKWHVHVNPEGNDTYAEMGPRCKSLGGHYNPYLVDLAVSIMALGRQSI